MVTEDSEAILKVKKLMECYLAFEEVFFKSYEENDEDLFMYQSAFKDALKAWNVTSQEALEEKTPEDFADEMIKCTAPEDVAYIFDCVIKEASSIPEVFLKFFKTFKSETEDKVLEILKDGARFLDREDMDDVGDEEFDSCLHLLLTVREAPLVGSGKINKAITDIYKKYDLCDDFLEYFQDSFMNMTPEEIMNALEGVEKYGEKESTPCCALANMDVKSDDIFRFLKNAFKKADDKLLYAMILEDYGDGRAVPALRKEVTKIADTYFSTADKEEKQLIGNALYDLKGIIEKLGGSCDDIFPDIFSQA